MRITRRGTSPWPPTADKVMAAPFEILHGDALAILRTLPDGATSSGSAPRTCITSPPYWGLRDYHVGGQLGLEDTPALYVERLVEVFREVRRVLAPDGTLWLNLGDTYNAYNGNRGKSHGPNKIHDDIMPHLPTGAGLTVPGIQEKILIGIPWRVAFALQADGWILRSDIIWAKKNCMPESVKDRPTRSHEYIFLLTKSPRYYYDAASIREPAVATNFHDATGPGYSAPGQSPQSGSRSQRDNFKRNNSKRGVSLVPGHAEGTHRSTRPDSDYDTSTRNKRSVWHVATSPFPEAHFATFPPKLIVPCVLAGSAVGDTVLDPFNGAGTTGVVACARGRRYLGIELNPEYVAMSRRRISEAAQQETLFQ